MSTVNPVFQNGSQLVTNYDITKIFLGANRYKTSPFTNNTGDNLTLKAGTLLGRITSNASAGAAYEVATATVLGTITLAGNAKAIVTSAIVAGSPLTISGIAVSLDDTSSQVATNVRAALNATAAVTANYTIGGTDAIVTLTAKVAAANDTSLLLEITNDTCTGLTDVTSTITTAGGTGTVDPNTIGQLIPFASNGTHGETLPIGIASNDYTFAVGETKNVNFCIGGDFDVNSLILAHDGDTINTIVNGREVIDLIRDLPLVDINVASMANFDNVPNS